MHLDDDDLPIGRVLSRRDAVRLLAISGAAVVAGCRPAAKGGAGETAAGVTATSATATSATTTSATTTNATATNASAAALPRCVGKPELTVGPYFLDKQLNRTDIRIEPSTGAESPGTPLQLAFRVQQIANGQCSPLPGAMVDIWQCDAAGMYSGVNDRMVGFNTEGKKFLRGYQVTDASGIANFTTIYPGWYQGRSVHIHFKIRTPAQAALADQTAYEFTSQVFFNESLTDQVHKAQPYAAKGSGRLRNERDGIYRQAGDVLLLNVALGQSGYATMFDVGLDLSDAQTGRPERSGGGGPPRRPLG
jgi:protocatechuate 3,4-dioxygenase beta subunit